MQVQDRVTMIGVRNNSLKIAKYFLILNSEYKHFFFKGQILLTFMLENLNDSTVH